MGDCQLFQQHLDGWTHPDAVWVTQGWTFGYQLDFCDKESLQRFSLPGEERRGLLLRLPAQVVVGFQLMKSPLQYKLTFCDYGPHKAEEICHQLKDLAIPIIKKMEISSI